jgi:hypothetical protein
MGQKLLIIIVYFSTFSAMAGDMDQMGNTFASQGEDASMDPNGNFGMTPGDGFGGGPSTYSSGNVPDAFKDIISRTGGQYNLLQKPQAKIGDGFYMLAMAGRMLGVSNVSYTDNPTIGYGSNLNTSLNGFTGYVGAGYGMQVNRAYIGLEGLVGKIRNQNHSKFYLNDTTLLNADDVTNQEMVVGVNWAVASRLGYYVSPVALLYGKLGVSQNNFTLKGRGDNVAMLFSRAASFNVMGYQWGGGLEVALNNHLSGRIETYQTIYKQFSPSYYDVNRLLRAQYKPRAQEMLLGIAVKPSALGGPMENSQYEEIPSGIYGGIEAGVSGTDFDRSFNGVVGRPSFVTGYKGHSASIKPAWGIYGGYAHTLGRFYVAGEAQLESNKSKVNDIFYRGEVNEYPNDFLGSSMALSTRFGYVFDNGTVGYGRIGVVRSRFLHNSISNGTLGPTFEEFTANRPYSKTLNGLRVGGGLEIALNRSVRLRGDYTLDIYPGISFPGLNPGTKESVRVTRNEAKLGLAYTLPPLY